MDRVERSATETVDCPRLTPLGILVLSILGERAAHPYDLVQSIRHRHEDRVVKLSVGSLYRTVDALAERGCIAPVETSRQGNRPERTLYTLTPLGQAALEARIAELFVEHELTHPPLAVALAEAHSLPADDVADLLRRRIDTDEDLLNLESDLDRARSRQVPEAYLLGFDYLKHMARAERDFLTRLERRLRDGDLPWPDPREQPCADDPTRPRHAPTTTTKD